MKNFFNEKRLVFFAGGPEAECAGDNGVCLPDSHESRNVPDVNLDDRFDSAVAKVENSVKSAGAKLGLETRMLTNESGNMEFSLVDGSGKDRFKIEIDQKSSKIRVAEFSANGGPKVMKDFGSMADALAYIPETDFGRVKQLSDLRDMTGLGVESMVDANGGNLAVFTDKKTGNRAFTVWNNADKTQFVLVKNTSSGGSEGKPYRGTRLSDLIKNHLSDVWKGGNVERIARG